MNFISFRKRIREILSLEVNWQQEYWEIREEILSKIDTHLFEVVDESGFFDSVERDQD